ESYRMPQQPGSIQSGIAVANVSSSAETVTFSLTQLDGTAIFNPVSINLAGAAQTSKLLSDLFPQLPYSFKGVLRITTTSTALSGVGLRIHYNERNEPLITTTPPALEDAPVVTGNIVFPHFVDGGGFTTQFILFNRSAGQAASGTLHFDNAAGQVQ